MFKEMQPPREEHQRTFTTGGELKRAEGWISCSTHISEKYLSSKPQWSPVTKQKPASRSQRLPLQALRLLQIQSKHKTLTAQVLNSAISSSFCSCTLLGSYQQPPEMDAHGRAHPFRHRTASPTQGRQRAKAKVLLQADCFPACSPAKRLDLFCAGFFNSAHHTLSDRLKTKAVWWQSGCQTASSYSSLDLWLQACSGLDVVVTSTCCKEARGNNNAPWLSYSAGKSEASYRKHSLGNMIPSQQTQYFTFKLIWAKKSSFSQRRSLIRLDRKRPVKISSSSFPGAQDRATLHAHTRKQAFQKSVMYQYTSPTTKAESMKDTAPFSPLPIYTGVLSAPDAGPCFQINTSCA